MTIFAKEDNFSLIFESFQKTLAVNENNLLPKCSIISFSSIPAKRSNFSCMNIPSVKGDKYCNVRVIVLQDLSILFI